MRLRVRYRGEGGAGRGIKTSWLCGFKGSILHEVILKVPAIVKLLLTLMLTSIKLCFTNQPEALAIQ